MSRLMSFALTEASFLDGTKTMTRRLGWWTDKNGRRLLLPGDRITGCRKVMGRKKGDPLVRLGEAHVTAVYRQKLWDVTDRVCEGGNVPRGTLSLFRNWQGGRVSGPIPDHLGLKDHSSKG